MRCIGARKKRNRCCSEEENMLARGGQLFQPIKVMCIDVCVWVYVYVCIRKGPCEYFTYIYVYTYITMYV